MTSLRAKKNEPEVVMDILEKRIEGLQDIVIDFIGSKVKELEANLLSKFELLLEEARNPSIRGQHDKPKKYNCINCEETFDNRRSMNLHGQKMHKKVSNVKYVTLYLTLGGSYKTN